MHKLIEKEVRWHNEQIAQTIALETDILLVEEILPEREKYRISLDHEVNVRWLCKDMQEIKNHLAIFARNGVMLKEFVGNNTSPMWRLKGRFSNICLIPDWSTDEANACRLVKVGEDTTPRAIYKLICNDLQKGGAETQEGSSDNVPF
jgi:hypothetical protein